MLAHENAFWLERLKLEERAAWRDARQWRDPRVAQRRANLDLLHWEKSKPAIMGVEECLVAVEKDVRRALHAARSSRERLGHRDEHKPLQLIRKLQAELSVIDRAKEQHLHNPRASCEAEQLVMDASRSKSRGHSPRRLAWKEGQHKGSRSRHAHDSNHLSHDRRNRHDHRHHHRHDRHDGRHDGRRSQRLQFALTEKSPAGRRRSQHHVDIWERPQTESRDTRGRRNSH